MSGSSIHRFIAYAIVCLAVIAGFASCDVKKACDSDAVCATGEICLLDVCLVGCRTKDQCPAGKFCVDFRCVDEECKAGSARTCYTGLPGHLNGKGTNVRFQNPFGVAYMPAISPGSGEYLFIAELVGQRLRQIRLSDKDTTLALGALAAGTSPDGRREDTRFLAPAGVAYDGQRKIYVADQGRGATKLAVIDENTGNVSRSLLSFVSMGRPRGMAFYRKSP